MARRTAALGVLLVVMTTLWLLLAHPALGIVFGGDDLSAVRQQIANLKNDAHELPELRSKLGEIRQKLRAAPTLWESGSAAETSASLQMRLKQIVGTAGGSVKDTADLSTNSEHGFVHVEVRADIVETEPAFYRTLVALETSTPAIFVDDVTLQSSQPGAPTIEPQLTVELVLSAYQADGS